MKRNRTIPLAAILAGIINGLLGTGGGVPLCLLLSRVQEEKVAYATASLGVLLLSLQTVLLYRGAALPFTEVSPLLPFLAVAGGALGAFLLGKVNVKLLRLLFAALLTFSGAYLLGKELYHVLY